MARNIEIKARVPDLDAVRASVRLLASHPGEILEQTDIFFAVPDGRLKVRRFSDGTGELIAYHRADRLGPKESVFARYPCQDARDLSDTLGRVLTVRGVVTKRREVFLVGRTRIHLDHVHNLGCFVEFEVVLDDGEPARDGERVARGLLQQLNIPDAGLVAEAYIDLLEAADGARGNQEGAAADAQAFGDHGAAEGDA
jgi:adenylate cyclase class IV